MHTFVAKKLSNIANSVNGNWKQVAVDLTSLKGMSIIELKFRATNDSSLPTEFYVDDVELVKVGI